MPQLLKMLLVWTLLVWPILITVPLFFIKFMASLYQIDEGGMALIWTPLSSDSEPGQEFQPAHQ
jgi:hypothetical protein